MQAYRDYMVEGRHSDALLSLASVTSPQIQKSRERRERVCLMTVDADNLGTALACHFIISKGDNKALTFQAINDLCL